MIGYTVFSHFSLFLTGDELHLWSNKLHAKRQHIEVECIFRLVYWKSEAMTYNSEYRENKVKQSGFIARGITLQRQHTVVITLQA